MCLHQSVRHCRHDFRPNEADGSRRIIAPPPLRVKLERVPIDRSGTKPAPIRSKLLLISAGFELSSWRIAGPSTWDPSRISINTFRNSVQARGRERVERCDPAFRRDD